MASQLPSTGYQTLAGLLRSSSLEHADEQIGYFWPDKLLSQIMTEERVVEALRNECLRIDEDDVERFSRLILEVMLLVQTSFVLHEKLMSTSRESDFLRYLCYCSSSHGARTLPRSSHMTFAMKLSHFIKELCVVSLNSFGVRMMRCPSNSSLVVGGKHTN